MKVLHELQKKEEKTKRIRAEVKAQDHGGCASSALSVLLAMFISDSCALSPQIFKRLKLRLLTNQDGSMQQRQRTTSWQGPGTLKTKRYLVSKCLLLSS